MTYQFDWDPHKARTNRAKHNVDFSDARRAFDDPFAIDWLDDRQDYGEDRFITLGVVEGRLLHVTYTMPDDRTIRIISAARPGGARLSQGDRPQSEGGARGAGTGGVSRRGETPRLRRAMR